MRMSVTYTRQMISYSFLNLTTKQADRPIERNAIKDDVAARCYSAIRRTIYINFH